MWPKTQRNCSSNNPAKEAYYNHIGSRLSETHIFWAFPTDASELLSNDLSQLTLFNTRGSNSVGQRTKMFLPVRLDKNLSNSVPTSEVSTSSSSSGIHASSLRILSPQTPACSATSDFTHEKRNVFHKVVGALFQKKHTCCRCKRKSRSCIENKTFSGLEKHFTCKRCREESNAVKNLFANHSAQPKSSTVQLPHDPYSKEVISPFSASDHKDSGYETATSSSPATSLCLTFTTAKINNVKATNEVNIDANLPPPRHAKVFNINNESSSRLESRRQSVNDASISYCTTVVNKSTKLSNFVGNGELQPSVSVLRQVRQRHIKDYDGYISDIPHNKSRNPRDVGQVPAYSTNIGMSSETDACQYRSNSQRKNRTSNQKVCHVCTSANSVFLRLPWKDGWICEDCLDNVQ